MRKINVVILTPKMAGFPIQYEAMDVARSAPQGALYYHADVIKLLP